MKWLAAVTNKPTAIMLNLALLAIVVYGLMLLKAPLLATVMVTFLVPLVQIINMLLGGKQGMDVGFNLGYNEGANAIIVAALEEPEKFQAIIDDGRVKYKDLLGIEGGKVEDNVSDK